MKQAIIYARAKADLSSFGLDSVNEQFSACKKYAEENDIQIVGLYADIALIGTKASYTNWEAIVDNKTPAYDYVIALDYSRVGRDILKQIEERKKLKEHNVRILCPTSNLSEEEENFLLEFE